MLCASSSSWSSVLLRRTAQRSAMRFALSQTAVAAYSPQWTSRKPYSHATLVCRKACVASNYTSEEGKKSVTHYSKMGMDGFTDVRFNGAADAFLEHVETVVDGLEHPEIDDVNCNGGVLTLETVNHGTFIINKQAPNVQLWLSSPVSGPHHYDMDVHEVRSAQDEAVIVREEVQWTCDGDGHDLKQLLQKELSDILGVTIQL